jgi:hypothetical protein
MSDTFCGSIGVNTKAGFVASNAIDGALAVPTKRMEILTENLTFTDQIVGGQGISGSVDPIDNHLREGARMVQGGFVTEIGPNELDPWINAILGNSSADETKEKPDLVPHDITLERDLVCHAYRYCIVRSAHIQVREDIENPERQVMKMALSFLGVEEKSTTFPGALTLSSGNRYYWMLGDSTFTYDGSALPLIDFDLRIDYDIRPLFRNQLLPGCFKVQGRRIKLDVSVPFSSTSATALFGSNGANKSAVISMGSGNLPVAAEDYATTFTMASTRRISKSANTTGPGEIPLKASLQAYQSGSTAALAISNTIEEA